MPYTHETHDDYDNDEPYQRMRYDHDLGGWHDSVEIVEQRVIYEETLMDLGVWDNE